MAKQMDMFQTAETLRDEALDRVLRHAGPWYPRAFAQAMTEVSRRCGEEKTAEQLRHLVYRIVGDPPHPNAWGAIIRELCKLDVIKEIGWAHMQDRKSHARRTPVYKLTPHLGDG